MQPLSIAVQISTGSFEDLDPEQLSLLAASLHANLREWLERNGLSHTFGAIQSRLEGHS